MPGSTFGYKEDCGYAMQPKLELLARASLAILIVFAFAAWITYRTPEQDEAIQKKLCERTHGRWVFDHYETSGTSPARRVYGCVHDETNAGNPAPSP